MSARYKESSDRGGYPTVCEKCGVRVTFRDTVWCEARVDHGRESKQTWHWECRPKQILEAPPPGVASEEPRANV